MDQVTNYLIALPVTLVVASVGLYFLETQLSTILPLNPTPKKDNDKEKDQPESLLAKVARMESENIVDKVERIESLVDLLVSENEQLEIPSPNTDVGTALPESEPGTESMAGSYYLVQSRLSTPESSIYNFEDNATDESKTDTPKNIADLSSAFEVEFWNMSESERLQLSHLRKFQLAFLEQERKMAVEQLKDRPFLLTTELSKIRKQKLEILDAERKFVALQKKIKKYQPETNGEAAEDGSSKSPFKIDQLFDKVNLENSTVNDLKRN